jgi:Lrp/AsnC family transcriptional regulator, leucine-responsive regulatory protein
LKIREKKAFCDFELAQSYKNEVKMSNFLDLTDRIILDALQADANTSIAELAERTAISAASVQRRLKRLREDGVIMREIAVIDPKRSVTPLTMIISVEINRERIDQLDTFRRRARAEPQVQQCYCVTGDTDFVLVVVVRDMADFEAFTHRFFFNKNNVRRYRTSVVITQDKLGLSLPFGTEQDDPKG